ncbi:NADH-quinone oxidoreductase chain 2 [Defluviimonas aquaemixtae]|uniref:NADH-quinone oxidoreductase chain 2 n=1 Tax=Albidovulum aquaemixtae TaxID=1542388 RepID=A0A2R8B3Z0_9RHOB|nr:NADH-quinone oxidoreductase subunit NuoE [Defluviimonas aquaemixtae]SPH17329.1 NADH-quinone oxidoreductase chain 2 [Defluviimonas aquaemixtae]
MLRRLHHDQPAAFEFTPANLDWAKAQMTKYPEGRQASAIIPLLWRAQEQEGWLSRPAIEHVADMLGLPHIRALEVATFYFMFQLQPVGSIAHIQVCGTTSCMICGAEDLVAVCKEKIAAHPHELSADGKFSWEEVECLGACANAPMVQIGKDYYEDLTAESFAKILDEFAAGQVPVPGPQNGRYACEPLNGLTSLKEYEGGRPKHNASVALAVDLKDTVKRIDGTETPVLTPWLGKPAPATPANGRAREPKPAEGKPVDATGNTVQEARAQATGAPATEPAAAPTKPRALSEPREGRADDLKLIKGVGPKLERLLNSLGFFHFDQIAGLSAAELAWVDDNLEGFKGRASRDRWVDQAKVLAEGGQTEFSQRAKKGDVY